MLAGRFPGTGDEPAIGDEVAHGGKAGDVMDFLEDDQGEDLTDAVYGLEKIEGMRIVLFGRLDDVEFDRLE